MKAGSSGQLVPGYRAKLTDENGMEVPAGEIGDLLISGDSAAPFYWNKHEKSKHTMRGEWMFTGDKYHVDADGYFWYDGRSDDMLKVGGAWVSPIEVETAYAIQTLWTHMRRARGLRARKEERTEHASLTT